MPLTVAESLTDADAQTTSGGPGMSLTVHGLVVFLISAFGGGVWATVQPLFAEDSTGEKVGIGAVLVAIGAGVSQLLNYFKDKRKYADEAEEKKALRQEKEREAEFVRFKEEKTREIAHMEFLLNRERDERKLLQSEVTEARQQATKALIFANRAEMWIKTHVAIMRVKGVEHIPWENVDDDSDDRLVRPHGPDRPDPTPGSP